MRRTPEDRACAVFHQHEIGDINRDPPIGIERVDRLEGGAVAALLGRFYHRFAGAEAVAFGDEPGEPRIALGETLRQRMVRRERHERCAVKRVRPSREHLDPFVQIGKAEEHASAFRAADPFLLHQPHSLGPTVEPVERRQQLLGKRGYAQRPLRQEAFFDERAGAPATPVDHLLIGQHGVLDGIPIDPGFLAIGEVGRQKVEKHLLFVAVKIRMAGSDFARPVIGEAHALQLGAHGGDVVGGPDCRMGIFGDRRILGRQAEGVPAHRMQYVEPLRPPITGDQIAHRIIADVADVQFAGRVGNISST